MSRLVVWLAGRAAEEVSLGDVSAGAGGRADSDLGKASILALDAVASYGLSRSDAVIWHRPAGDPVARSPQALQNEAAQLVRTAYSEAKTLIERDWDFVNLVSMDLMCYRAIAHRQFVRCDRRPRPDWTNEHSATAGARSASLEWTVQRRGIGRRRSRSTDSLPPQRFGK